MSNTNDKDRDPSDNDALKALREISESDESETEETEEGDEAQGTETEESAGGEGGELAQSPSASGFVGMLVEQGKDGEGKGLDAGSSPTQSASGGESSGGEGTGTTTSLQKSGGGTTDKIYMAKEIGTVPDAVPPAPGSAGGSQGAGAAAGGAGVRTVRKGRPAPGWYHAAVPVMYTLGALLILIGLWAIGALIFMAVKAPDELGHVAYPFLTPERAPDNEDIWIYTQGSHIMAWMMLVCLPVSLAMGMMAGIMQQQIRRSTPKTETKHEN
ncbi:MAG: hypothetical protein FWD61_12795 [Phycisphaerales bacterium]|nr:hypothetical protein [Phycisphaerales bacterium]